MLTFLTNVLYIFIAICVLLFMITVHEFGHYTAGKLLKFKINEFSIGFGKAIFSKTKKNGEKFSLRIFPLGGYCAFEGEDKKDDKNPQAFNNQKAWKRLIVLFMGAFFNFLSALIFAVIFLMSYGYVDKVQITTVQIPSSYSESAEEWLKEGDVIVAVNGKQTNFVYDELFSTLTSNIEMGENFFVTVSRNGENKDLTIYKSWFNLSKLTSALENNSPLFSLGDGNYNFACMSVAVSQGDIDTFETQGLRYRYYDFSGQKYLLKFYNISIPTKTYTVVEDGTICVDNINYNVEDSSFTNPNDLSVLDLQSSKIGVTYQNYKYGFFEALGQTFAFCFGWALKILIILWQLISFQLPLSNLGGTVTTIATIAEVSQANIASLLLLIPLISINLAVFNLLPFPALDGARMVFVLIEMIRKKPINREVEGTIHFVGLVILLAFVLFVDIWHFIM